MLGEETVLLKALEGKRGQPEQRPPHPAERGLFGNAHGRPERADPGVRARGSSATAARRSRRSASRTARARSSSTSAARRRRASRRCRSGRRCGHRRPRRASARRPEAQGDPDRWPDGRDPAADALDTPYTFEALRAVGAHIGSGSVVVADDRACVVDLARLLTRFSADEACGKTIPCRIGLRRLARDRRADHDGHVARPTDADAPGRPRRPTSSRPRLCDHERLATLPMMSGLRYFRAELDAHLLRGACPAGVCRPPIAVATGAPTERRDMADLIIRPGRADPERRPPSRLRQRPRAAPTAVTPPIDDRRRALITTQAPQRPQSTPRDPDRGRRPRGRGPRGPDDPRGLPRQRHRDPDPVLRAQAARASAPAACASSRSRARSIRRSRARATCEDGMKVQTQTEEVRRLRRDEPRADLLRPQRVLPAALPEQVPEPHRHPGLPQAERRGQLARVDPDLQAHDPVPLRPRPRVPGAVRGALPPRRGRRGDRDPRLATATPATRSSRRCSTRTSTRRCRSSSRPRPAAAPRSSAPGRPAWPPPTTCCSPATT